MFDETTNSQVKNQYGAYLSYLSNCHNKVVNLYVDSLFVGPCKVDDLVEKYNEFVKIVQLDSNYLLHIRMEGPNANLSFERKLATNLEEMDTTFLRIGSCSLHPTHTERVSKSIERVSKGYQKVLQRQV